MLQVAKHKRIPRGLFPWLLRKSSVVYSVKGLGMNTPALFTSRLILPKLPMAESTTCFATLRLAISPSTSFKRSPGCSVLADVIFLEFATTQYPVSRSRSAIPRPMPLDAPVTIATFVLTGESRPDDVARPSICCPKGISLPLTGLMRAFLFRQPLHLFVLLAFSTLP